VFFIFRLSLMFRMTSLSLFKDQMHTRFYEGLCGPVQELGLGTGTGSVPRSMAQAEN